MPLLRGPGAMDRVQLARLIALYVEQHQLSEDASRALLARILRRLGMENRE